MKKSAVREIVIIGAGGHGSELISYLQDLRDAGEPVRLMGFVDENKAPGPFLGSKILGGFQELRAFLRRRAGRPIYYLTAVGNNKTRLKLVGKIERMKAKGFLPWMLRHPSANVGRRVEIGEGTCLAPGSLVTTRVRMGRHCILNVQASISHDCVIGDFVNINPHAAVCGNVKIGEGCTIGAGAIVIESVSIGEWSVIGAGAVVIDDIPSRVTAVGIPARAVKAS